MQTSRYMTKLAIEGHYWWWCWKKLVRQKLSMHNVCTSCMAVVYTLLTERVFLIITENRAGLTSSISSYHRTSQPVSLTRLPFRKLVINFIVIWFLKFILFSCIFFVFSNIKTRLPTYKSDDTQIVIIVEHDKLPTSVCSIDKESEYWNRSIMRMSWQRRCVTLHSYIYIHGTFFSFMQLL